MLAITEETLEKMRAAVRQRIRTGERNLELLRTALADLDAAERLLAFFENDKRILMQVEAVGEAFSIFEQSASNPFRRGSIRAAIWEVLDFSAETWLTTAEVHRQTSELLGCALSMNSIATTLSRMKPKVMRRGLYVASALRALVELDIEELEDGTKVRPKRLDTRSSLLML